MREKKEFAITLVVMFIVIFIATITFHAYDVYSMLFPSYTIEDYSAKITSSGLLYENYTYQIYANNRYHMLYRIWDSPLWYINISKEGIFLLNISVQSNKDITWSAVPYVRDAFGSVWLLHDQNDSEALKYVIDHAEKSEAGVYFPYGIPAGKYTVSYVFLLKPVLDYDGHNYGFTISLARSHSTYENVNIYLPGNFTVFNSPYLEKTKINGLWKISGKSIVDFPLELTLIFQNGKAFSHYAIQPVSENLINIAQRNSFHEEIIYWGFYYLMLEGYLAIIAIPIIYTVIYLAYGKEKSSTQFYFTEEEDIYAPPAERDPLTVNFIFRYETTGIDYKSVLPATLIYFKRKGIIDISEDGTKIYLKNDDPSIDLGPYYQIVFYFIKNHSKDGVLDLKATKDWIEKSFHLHDSGEFTSYVSACAELYLDPDEADKIQEKFIYIPSKKVYRIAYVGLILMGASLLLGLLFAIRYYTLWTTASVLYLIMTIQSLLTLLYPDVIGRWKDDYYQEKLKWDKFREFLKDEKRLKEAYQSFRDYYEDWLMYGYALGVGKKVTKALSSSEIDFPLAKTFQSMTPYLTPVFFAQTTASGSSVAGGAGGFGGGGAGAR